MLRAYLAPIAIFLGIGCAGSASAQHRHVPPGYDVIYQIFPRSYRDSNGDRVGDFKGIEQGLSTIQKLGCTALLINPIWKSEMYHNYFSSDWYQPDPGFGTLASFRHLARAAHRRHMKIILDMEPQYVQQGHPWMSGGSAAVSPSPTVAARVRLEAASLASQEPGGETPAPTQSESGLLIKGMGYIFGEVIPTYNHKAIKVAAVNLNNPLVRKEISRVFVFWAKQGADGFRIDHMMDDLDAKRIETDLFAKLWNPLEAAVRRVYPNTLFVAEQSDWKTGKEIIQATKTDAVFGFLLAGAIRSFDKAKIEAAMRDAEKIIPDGRTNFTFLENHDVERFASQESNPRKLRLGAGLLLTMRGSPNIYYGQELGMRGKQGQWQSDANDIPVRLAYRWGSTLDAPGTALWYKNSGPWWNTTYSSDHDGVSVAEEEKDPNSLFNWYLKLIHLRLAHPALRSGSELLISSRNPQLLEFARTSVTEIVVVDANLGPTAVRVPRTGTDLLTGKASSPDGYFEIPAWGLVVIGK